MKFNLIVLLLIVCVLELTRGYYYDEEEDGLRVIVKRQANYYNNYDYNAETTTLATTKKKLIKRCPTNAAGKRIRCKKKKKRTTTTTTTTEEPIGLPPSFLRGPPGINPISFFLGPGSFYSPTTPSTVSTTITTNKPSLNSLPTVKLGGNFLHNLPIITGGMLPRSPPTNSSLLNVPAAIASQFPFNTSFPGENNRISPAGAIQLSILPKMIKTCNSSTSINVDPIVSGSTTVPTTPSSLINSLTTGSKLGSLVLPIGSSGLNASSLNFFLPNNSTIQINTATTIKPAGLSNVTNSISNTSNPILRPILRDMPMFPIQNLTSEVNSNSSQNTIVAPIMTTGSSNMGSLLGRIGFPIGISGTTVSSTILTTASSSSSVTLLTTVASNMGSFLGRVGLPVGLSPITSLNSSIQTLLPITTTSIPLTTSKSTTVLPILSSTSNQSIPSSSTTVKLGLILPLQPNAILSSTTLGTTVSSVTLSNTTNSSLSTNATTTISSQQTTLAISKDSSTVPSMATIIKDSGTTIGLAVNGTSTTSSNALTTKKSSKTTKKKGKKRKTTKKKNQKKTTKKAGKKQGTTNQKGNGEKKQE